MMAVLSVVSAVAHFQITRRRLTLEEATRLELSPGADQICLETSDAIVSVRMRSGRRGVEKSRRTYGWLWLKVLVKSIVR